MYWKTPTLPHSSSLNYLNLSYYARGTKEEWKKKLFLWWDSYRLLPVEGRVRVELGRLTWFSGGSEGRMSRLQKSKEERAVVNWLPIYP